MLGKFINIKVKGEELEKIFEDLNKAEDTILDCYGRLKELGVLEISDPQNDEN